MTEKYLNVLSLFFHSPCIGKAWKGHRQNTELFD
jgi:hypothetical protein